MAITDNQMGYPKKLLSGPDIIPVIVFAKLRDAGLVEKAEGVAGGRGMSYVKITAAGRAAVEG